MGESPRWQLMIYRVPELVLGIRGTDEAVISVSGWIRRNCRPRHKWP